MFNLKNMHYVDIKDFLSHMDCTICFRCENVFASKNSNAEKSNEDKMS